ncbi:MAG: cytochrome P450, partial [Rhizobiales bacterium]|nr:cytochrome P450 [Hyphomicrobiales bacterium]
MTRLVPPCPRPVRKLPLWLGWPLWPWRFLQSRYSTLAALVPEVYSMKLGQWRTFARRIYLANDPELVRRVLVDEAEDFPKDAVIADMLELLMGDSIFVSNGAVWKRQRRMMDPAFEGARIKLVFELMRDAADALIERLDAAAGQPEIHIDVEMTHVTADIIFRTLFSRALTAEEAREIFDAFQEFQELAYAFGINRTAGLPDWMSPGLRRKAAIAAARIRAVLDPIVKTRYDAFHSGAKATHNDILQSLVSVKDPENGTHFDLRELNEQVAMLFLAGHETSASALSWSLYLIAAHSETQTALHDECSHVLGARLPQFSDMKRLPRARNVFNEALRLYPPVTFLPRTSARTCPMSGKTIRAGSIVSVSPWTMQRHTRHWQDPHAFD